MGNMKFEILRSRLRQIIVLIGFIVFEISVGLNVTNAQVTDPAFTQYMNSMQTVNPAYVGIWDKTGFQVFTRRYYLGQDKAPLVNSMILYSPLKNENFGVGLDFIDERFGYEKRLTVALDYAYQIRIDRFTHLRFGFNTGFMNYDNMLTRYDLNPGQDIPDPMFQTDVHNKYMFKAGFGLLLYSDEYYIGFSVPQMVENSFAANRNNFSSLAEVRYMYLLGGYLFGDQLQVQFKPTVLIKGSAGGRIQADIAANVMFHDKFWVGLMYRTNNTIAALTQVNITKNIRVGYAAEFPFTRDIAKYQLGTHEIRIAYEFDLYGRMYTRKHYF